MRKIFVSCGQYTEAEKFIGKEIVRIVKAVTGIDAFFAEDVQDLNGLDSNILSALRECVGFITVIHPRGKITRPDGSTHIRASVWIEQEIAIATYIQRVERRSLPVIAFIHKTVGREGIRDLLHLNPIFFNEETEIISALPQRLAAWKGLTSASISLHLQLPRPGTELEHRRRRLIVSVANGSNQRIKSFNCEVRLPAALLKHTDLKFLPDETETDDPRYSCYRFDEMYKPAIAPHATEELIVFPCCMTCAVAHTGEIPPIAAAIIEEYVIQAKLWVDGREYEIEKTIHDLLVEAESA
jgi:hypothetical protein